MFIFSVSDKGDSEKMNLKSEVVTSSETQGQSVGSGEKAGRKFSSTANEPLGTDSHRTIFKNSSECWLLIGHKKML